ESFEFEWYKGNSTKSAKKHGVATEEIESVFDLKMAVPVGKQVKPHTDEERLCIVGPSLEERMISVVFTLREGRVRPISGRPANFKERRLYEDVLKALKNI
ncbi:MAG: hypothetical protein A3F16_05390, partial [Deltaproteobacteria bacterium RIFCSPHIGHO2_12_FULL_43_9]